MMLAPDSKRQGAVKLAAPTGLRGSLERRYILEDLVTPKPLEHSVGAALGLARLPLVARSRALGEHHHSIITVLKFKYSLEVS
jgi:hypothetical protein